MKEFIRKRRRRTIVIFFLSVYAVALVFALFPRCTLPAAESAHPFSAFRSIMYWIFDWAVLGLGLWGFYVVEDIRGELDEGHPTAPPPLTGE